jgi:hypothetical protein
LHWFEVSVIIATLFFNIRFWEWYGGRTGTFCPILPYSFAVTAGAALTAILFFLAPAAITQATSLSLHRALENALGSVPALGLRLGAIVFLVLWMAGMIAVPVSSVLRSVLRQEGSDSTPWVIAAVVAPFVFITGLQSAQTTAKLAMFSNKLGLAVLLAAMLRVREGLPEAMNVLWRGYDQLPHCGIGFSVLMFYAAPLSLLAANLGRLLDGRRQVAMTAAMGIAAPLIVVLVMIGVTNAATVYSGFYRPSLSPSISMALFSHAAESALPGPMLIVTITMFGVLRFGVRSLAETVDPAGIGVPWIRLLGPALAVAWLATHEEMLYQRTTLDVTAACLICASAVLSADWITGAWRTRPKRRMDCAGMVALLAGLASIPLWQAMTGAEWRWRSWLLPSYGAAFLVCLLGRYVQRFSRGNW